MTEKQKQSCTSPYPYAPPLPSPPPTRLPDCQPYLAASCALLASLAWAHSCRSTSLLSSDLKARSLACVWAWVGGAEGGQWAAAAVGGSRVVWSRVEVIPPVKSLASSPHPPTTRTLTHILHHTAAAHLLTPHHHSKPHHHTAPRAVR